MSISRFDIDSGVDRLMMQNNYGHVLAFPSRPGTSSAATTGVPTNGTAGWAPGALFHNYKGGPGTSLYVNVGTNLSSLWIALDAAAIGSQVGSNFQTNAGNTPLTLTAANISGGAEVYLALTATLAGAGAVTLPTVASYLAAIPGAFTGMGLYLRIINESGGAFAWTVTTNTGWTLTGTMTIAQNTWRDFVITVTSVPSATATLQNIGTGTFS